jgi:hypothetical protein
MRQPHIHCVARIPLQQNSVNWFFEKNKPSHNEIRLVNVVCISQYLCCEKLLGLVKNLKLRCVSVMNTWAERESQMTET